jgi:hypothetical protein
VPASGNENSLSATAIPIKWPSGRLTGSLLIFGTTWLLIRWIGTTTRRALLGTGSLWLALTVAFEIGFGRLAGRSWETIGSDYDLRHGGLLLLGLVVLVLSPLAAARARGVAPKPSAPD